MTFRGHSRSSEMSQFHRTPVVFYYRSVVTMALSCTVSYSHILAKNREIYTPDLLNAPVGGDPVGISQRHSVLKN